MSWMTSDLNSVIAKDAVRLNPSGKSIFSGKESKGRKSLHKRVVSFVNSEDVKERM
jgi:hypothetical protein